MNTKAKITAERDELREVVDGLVHTAEILIASSKGHHLPTLEAAMDARVFVDQAKAIQRAWERGREPEHALATAARVPRTGPGGVTAQGWRYERLDRLPVSQSLTEVCEPCGCRVALLSARRRDGAHFTVRVDFDGFKHECDRQKQFRGEAPR